MHDFATRPFDAHGTEPQRTAALLAELQARGLSFDATYRMASAVAAGLESTWFGDPDAGPLGEPIGLIRFLSRDLSDADPFGLVMRGARGYQNTSSDTLNVEVVWLTEVHASAETAPVRTSARSARALVAPQESVVLRQCSRTYSADWLAARTVRVLVNIVPFSRTGIPTQPVRAASCREEEIR